MHDFFLERGVTSVSAVHHATQCCWCNEKLRECSQIQLQVNIPQQAIVFWTEKQITLRCCVTIALNWGVYAYLMLLHRGHTNLWCVLWWTGNSLITEYQFTVMTNICYRKYSCFSMRCFLFYWICLNLHHIHSTAIHIQNLTLFALSDHLKPIKSCHIQKYVSSPVHELWYLNFDAVG